MIHVAIIGGGISGLSAGWYVQQQAQAKGLALRYTILESADRWGGKIRTEQIDGFGDPFVIEAGPDSFLTQKPWALQLARELGLDEQLLGTNDHTRQTFVLNKNRLTPLPDGVMLLVPSKFMPFVRSPLISPLGKLRMGLDLFIRPKRDNQDETLAEFVTRRLGAEALDKIAEPLLSGIYNAEAERQSILATFPRFREIEAKHGSLTRGMLASRRPQPSQPGSNGQGKGKAVSTFVSLRVGMEALVHTLVGKLTGTLCLNTGVQSIEQTANGGYKLLLSSGETLEADAVMMTTPAHTTAKLLRPLAPQAADSLESIRYVSTGTISLAFRGDEIKHPLNGFGVVIPRSERRPINAITWSSTKFDHRAPKGYALLRIFFGGSRSPETMELDDLSVLVVARNELKALMGIDAAPLFHRIYRWYGANPQYDVGHLERVSQIEASLPQGIYVTGSAYRGVGIPDCVHQAQQTTQQLVAALSS